MPNDEQQAAPEPQPEIQPEIQPEPQPAQPSEADDMRAKGFRKVRGLWRR